MSEEKKVMRDKRMVKWPSRVAAENPVEDIIETYKLMFLGKKVTPMIFSSASRMSDLDLLNNYVSKSAKKHNLPSLLYTRAEWTSKELKKN